MYLDIIKDLFTNVYSCLLAGTNNALPDVRVIAPEHVGVALM
jgi:hypothetical protein